MKWEKRYTSTFNAHQCQKSGFFSYFQGSKSSLVYSVLLPLKKRNIFYYWRNSLLSDINV